MPAAVVVRVSVVEGWTRRDLAVSRLPASARDLPWPLPVHRGRAPQASAGWPGSGSPSGGGGGGQRGPGGKEHKASKALRRKRNGELVIGEPDAVVPVIGDDGPDTEAAEPSMPQPVPAGSGAAGTSAGSGGQHAPSRG